MNMNSILEIALIWGLILLWCIFAFMTFAICSVRERKRRKEKGGRGTTPQREGGRGEIAIGEGG